MSYDYDALVKEFIIKRQQAEAETADANARQVALQEAVQALETLSSHCPMTPLLWIQYAAALNTCFQAMGADMITAKQAQREALALGLVEFPGSLLLQCRHVQACLDENENSDLTIQALESAISQVGKGSYRKPDTLVAWLYGKLADQHKRNDNLEAAFQVFFEQALVPLAHVNDALQHTIQTWTEKRIPSTVLGALETGRRLVAKVFTAAAPDAQADDEVEAQLHQAGILDHSHIVWNAAGDINWTNVEFPAGQRYGMGYGEASLARAFAAYASSCTQQHPIEDEENPGLQALQYYKHKTLPWSIYERGVAECPTVEFLWLAYIKDLRQGGSTDQRQKQLSAVIQRACRNCPYSIALVQQDLETTRQLTTEGLSDFEPDALLQRVETAWDRGFFPGGPATWCDLMLQVVSVVRQTLLSLCYPDYDKDDKKKMTKNVKLDDETLDEIVDLREDVAELYETLLNKLHEKFPDYVTGRSRMLQEKALVDYHLLQPLHLGRNFKGSSDGENDASEALAKAARIHPHPDTYLTWIHFTQYNKPSPPDDQNATHIVQCLALIRLAFLHAWQQVSQKATGQRDFYTALADLSHEWVQWECLFGSAASLQRAQSMIHKKYQRMQEQQQKELKKQERHNKGPDKGRAKRHADEATEERLHKKAKSQQHEDISREQTDQAPVDSIVETKKKIVTRQLDLNIDTKEEDSRKKDDANSKKERPKVTINGMEYPAHPFTVRVSNLAPDVEDMDLVDLLRPKCGAIVHARIVREKGHGKTPSRGWGLVQFEETEAVDKAIQLSEQVGLREKLVTIDRSNTPAVSLVPPGMHRVNPKGEGRSSKRNEKRKEKNTVENFQLAKQDKILAESNPSALQPGVLSLAPRGVLKRASRPKPKLIIASKESHEPNEK